jgi:hypothetical protein
MKALSRCLFLTVFAIVIILSSISFAEEPVPKKEPVAISDIPISEYQWLVGSWIGVIEKEKETRSLEISLAKEGMKAKYGVTGKGMGYTKLEISGGNIFFETGSKSKVNLHKASNSQMEGTFETSEGRITKVTFIRNDTSPSSRPEAVAVALTQDTINKVGWAIGTWKGFVGGQKNDWTIELKTIDTTTVTEGKESINIKGSVRFKEDKPSNLVVKLTDNKVTFKLWGKEDYALERINDNRMEGSKKDPGGKEYMIRFWKLGKEGLGPDNAKNSPFFGVWEGLWNPSPKGRYTIEYVDNTAATILYEWNNADSWEWQNVSISPNGEFRVGPDNRYMVYRLSKDKKNLEGELFVSGEKTSSINAEKKVQESEKLLKPRSLSSTFANTASSQPVSPELRWVIGKWKGFQHWSKNVWTLEIVEKDGKLNGSFMLVTDKSKMYPISINASDKTLVFQSATKEEFVLNRASDNRMDGKYTNTNRQERTVRFWKEGGINTNPLLGVWEGIWDVGQKVRFTVERIDATAASVRDDWGAWGDTNKGGWQWENASVRGREELRIENPDTMVVTILNLSKDQQSLKAEYLRSGNTVCAANLSKIDPNALPSTTGQNLPREISAFLGTWEGPWNDGTKLQLVVEKINLKEADVVFTTEDSPYWGKGHKNRYAAKVDANEATIKWGRNNELIFTIKKDLDNMDFTIKYGTYNSALSTTMKRIK